MVRSFLWCVPLATVVLGTSAGAYAWSTAGGPRMGPPSSISRKAFEGYYDGHKDTYLNTDVSDKAEAVAMHINYAPELTKVPLTSLPEIYLVQGWLHPGSSPSLAPSRASRATRRSGRRRS
jgi:hypothetical protein